MPSTINLGLFYVNASAVRKFLVERHRQIAHEILSLIANRVRLKGAELDRKFGAILSQLNPSLTSIEAVAELEEYVTLLPQARAGGRWACCARVRARVGGPVAVEPHASLRRRMGCARVPEHRSPFAGAPLAARRAR